MSKLNLCAYAFVHSCPSAYSKISEWIIEDLGQLVYESDLPDNESARDISGYSAENYLKCLVVETSDTSSSTPYVLEVVEERTIRLVVNLPDTMLSSLYDLILIPRPDIDCAVVIILCYSDPTLDCTKGFDT